MDATTSKPPPGNDRDDATRSSDAHICHRPSNGSRIKDGDVSSGDRSWDLSENPHRGGGSGERTIGRGNGFEGWSQRWEAPTPSPPRSHDKPGMSWGVASAGHPSPKTPQDVSQKQSHAVDRLRSEEDRSGNDRWSQSWEGPTASTASTTFSPLSRRERPSGSLTARPAFGVAMANSNAGARMADIPVLQILHLLPVPSRPVSTIVASLADSQTGHQR